MLVLVAAIASYAGFTAISTTTTVLVTAVDVARGEVIERTDLAAIEVAAGQATGTVPATRASEIVGQFATVDLPAGALVLGTTVHSTLPLEPGTSVVGVSLTAAQLPTTALRAGDRIRLVSTPIAQGEPPTQAPLTIAATVFATRLDERTGATIVDVVVPTETAADVAARAATGRVAVVLDGAVGA